jgi:hypothetical protein
VRALTKFGGEDRACRAAHTNDPTDIPDGPAWRTSASTGRSSRPEGGP